MLQSQIYSGADALAGVTASSVPFPAIMDFIVPTMCWAKYRQFTECQLTGASFLQESWEEVLLVSLTLRNLIVLFMVVSVREPLNSLLTTGRDFRLQE